MPFLKKALVRLIPNIKLTTSVPFGGSIQFLARTHKGFLVRTVTDYPHEACIFRYYEETVSASSVVFDVGANIGLHAVPLSLLAIRGTVVAFEPDSDNLDLLRTNVRRNKVDGRIVIVSKAVSDSTGHARFWRDVVSSATGTLEPRAGNSWFHEYTKHEPVQVVVETTTIDDYVAANPSLTPQLVKIDVEGAEAKVLNGMRRTLVDIGPDVIIDGMRCECIAPLTECGYKLFDLTTRLALPQEIANEIPFTVLGKSRRNGNLT